MYKVLIGIQARSNSSRFPDKIYEVIGQKTMIEHVVERCKMVRGQPRLMDIEVGIVAPPGDDKLRGAWPKLDCTYYSPEVSEDDLVSRYAGAVAEAEADFLIRVTADCPLIPPSNIEGILKGLGHADYVTNVSPRTFRDGYDCQGISRSGLDWVNRYQMIKREHPFIQLDEDPNYRKKFEEDGFMWMGLTNDSIMIPNPYHPRLKCSVDTREDLKRVRDEYQRLQEAMRKGRGPGVYGDKLKAVDSKAA